MYFDILPQARSMLDALPELKAHLHDLALTV